MTTPNFSYDDPLNSIIAKILEAENRGEAVDREALYGEHPELADSLRSFFSHHQYMKSVSGIDEPTLPLAAEGITGDEPTLAFSGTVSDQRALPLKTNRSTAKHSIVGDQVCYFGDYELLEEIARGGMGIVFKAKQINLNRIVALKMILSGQFAGEEDVQRFYTEAEAAAQLDHPGIVPIFEIGEHQGKHYFSMGYVEGVSLAHKVADGPLPPRAAVELVKKVCDAMQYAHERGVIHRDLKPANILIDVNGQPKITDFGLAKRTDVDSNLTGAGQILGTPAYMPPEQASGNNKVGPLADVYSLGAVLYCLLTGRPPFQAASPMDTLLQVLERDTVPPRMLNPQIPKDLDTICLKCLRKESHLRYSSALTLADDLHRWLEGIPILARPVTRMERGWRWCRRQPVLAGLLSATAALVIALGILGIVAIAEVQRRLAAETARDMAEADRIASGVESLLNAPAVALPYAIANMYELRDLAVPILEEKFAGPSTDSHHRFRAAIALAEYGRVNNEFIVDSIADARSDECANICGALAGNQKAVMAELQKRAEISEQHQNWILKARLAIVVLQLGDARIAQDMLKLRPDPIQRTVFIDVLPTWHGDVAYLLRFSISDGAFTSGLCLGVGGIPPDDISPHTLKRIEARLRDWYQHRPDTGTHSASGWALKQLGLSLPTLSVGNPQSSEEQPHIASLTLKAAELEQQVLKAERELPRRRQAWEQKILDQSSENSFGQNDGLLAHYTFDDDHNRTIANRVTGQPAAEYVGPTELKTNPGVVGSAIHLDGNACVYGDESLRPKVSESVSAGCWYLQEAESIGGSLFTIADGFRGIHLALSRELLSIDLRYDREMATYIQADLGAMSGWHHVMLTSDGSGKPESIKLYLDGKTFESAVIRVGLLAPAADNYDGFQTVTTPVTIGNHSGRRGPLFAGEIDEVRIYDRILNSIEITQLYQAGLQSLANLHESKRTAEQWELLTNAHRVQDKTLMRLRDLYVIATTELRESTWNWAPGREGGLKWLFNSYGLTLLRVPAGHFTGKYGRVGQVTEDFLLSDQEISVGLFQQFINDPNYPAKEKPNDWPGIDNKVSSTGDHPVQNVNWFDAVMFCNWMSRSEGLVPCYERTGEKDKNFMGPNSMAPDVWRFNANANGYRLPTTAEWEHACRAGTSTAFSFGEDEKWLVNYAACRTASAALCRQKAPNSWGYFDMHGNVEEWCNDAENAFGPNIKGGHVESRTEQLESSSRLPMYAKDRSQYRGFRVAATPFSRQETNEVGTQGGN